VPDAELDAPTAVALNPVAMVKAPMATLPVLFP
jgi:hypothetical protein